MEPPVYTSSVLVLEICAGERQSSILGYGGGRVELTSSLYEEGEDIADDEDLGEPIRTDRCHAFTVRKEDDTAEDHVDACCEEGRREEQE